MNVQDTARAIGDMTIRGAGRIARSAAAALENFAASYQGDDLGDMQAALEDAARQLMATRPTAVSLQNAIQASMKGTANCATVEELRRQVATSAGDFIQSSRDALDKIGDIGSKRIEQNSVIMTHCNSEAAISVIVRAHQAGRVKMVFATESRPKRQGHITVRTLAKAGVPVTMIVDSAVRHTMKDVDVAIVGADTVASNGAVINKIGTSQIALCAHEARVPLIVCAETYKFSPETLIGSRVEIEQRDAAEIAEPSDFEGVGFFNPVFDATPPEYIDAIITERGVISPHAAFTIIRDMAGK